MADIGRVFDSSTRGWIADVIVNYVSGSDETKIYVDGSLGARDLSINELYTLTGEGCVKEASLGTDFVWNAGYLDISTNYLKVNDASILYSKRLTTFVIKDVSYLATETDNNNIIFADTSTMIVTFPNTLPIGFQTTVVNRTTGNVTLNASTLYTTDSSVVLRDRYAAASIVCSSTGVFYAFGNLK